MPISRKNDFLVYSSDRSGSMQAYRLDLKTGQSHALTEAMDLDGLKDVLRGMRAVVASISDVMATKDDLAEVRKEIKSDVNSLRTDVTADLLATRKELGDQIVGLRRAVVEYHSSTIGHGILNSELEARMRRVEQHLSLPPLETH